MYGYANSTVLRDDSVLNPRNQIAHLAQRSDAGELRFNLKAENDSLRFTARPIISRQVARNSFGSSARNDAYLSQWQVRINVAEGWNLAAGREVMNWGAAQFRSPSSPFYFDNGRNDPVRELTGMDSAKLTWTPDMQHSMTLAHIVRAGNEAAQGVWWRDSWLAKFDRRAEDTAYGVVVVKAAQLPSFVGFNAQLTMNDEWLMYGEASSSVQAHALQSPADAALPFNVSSPSTRRSTALLGTAYTLENGQTVNAEYLHDGHGYSVAQEHAYFQRARAAPGLALGLMPRLLGRDYLHLVWQSNLLDSGGYCRVMATHNVTDGGLSLGAYGEKTLHNRISAFVIAVFSKGTPQQEGTALFSRTITFGLNTSLN